MGKYIRKAKKTEGVSPLGVLTRAKALALNGGDGGSYLELRSRKLVKPFTVLEGRKQKNGVPKNPNLVNPNPNQKKECLDAKEMEEMENLKEIEKSCCGPEDSFGENLLEFEGRKRTTRESTPCSLIRDSDNIPTPGSSTRHTNANEANSRVPNSVQAVIPTAREMDEFFARAEAEQQRKFIEKYNFDPVNDKPLPGRYIWEKVTF